jgi:hypothetical protein
MPERASSRGVTPLPPACKNAHARDSHRSLSQGGLPRLGDTFVTRLSINPPLLRPSSGPCPIEGHGTTPHPGERGGPADCAASASAPASNSDAVRVATAFRRRNPAATGRHPNPTGRTPLPGGCHGSFGAGPHSTGRDRNPTGRSPPSVGRTLPPTGRDRGSTGRHPPSIATPRAPTARTFAPATRARKRVQPSRAEAASCSIA